MSSRSIRAFRLWTVRTGIPGPTRVRCIRKSLWAGFRTLEKELSERRRRTCRASFSVTLPVARHRRTTSWPRAKRLRRGSAKEKREREQKRKRNVSLHFLRGFWRKSSRLEFTCSECKGNATEYQHQFCGGRRCRRPHVDGFSDSFGFC